VSIIPGKNVLKGALTKAMKCYRNLYVSFNLECPERLPDYDPKKWVSNFQVDAVKIEVGRCK